MLKRNMRNQNLGYLIGNQFYNHNIHLVHPVVLNLYLFDTKTRKHLSLFLQQCDVLLHSISIIIQDNEYMQKYEVMYHKIASEIKKLRKNAKLSQEDLAEKLNCSREFISRVENDKEKVSLKMIFTLSEVFNVSPKIFFD